MMEVNLSNLQNIIDTKQLTNSTKYIWMSAKDLYQNLNNEAIGNINSKETVDLLGLTKRDEEISDEFSDESSGDDDGKKKSS